MKIRMTFDIPLNVRLAIAHEIGSNKPASRASVTHFINTCVESVIADKMTEYEADTSEGEGQ